jgi:hypothetical protein
VEDLARDGPKCHRGECSCSRWFNWIRAESFQPLKIDVIFLGGRMIRRDSGSRSNNTTWYKAVFHLETNIFYKSSATGPVIFVWLVLLKCILYFEELFFIIGL